MLASDWKLIEDIRNKINGTFDNKDVLALRIAEGFQGAGKELTGKAAKLRAQMAVKLAREWNNTRLRLDKLSQALEDCANLRLKVLADSIRDSPRFEEFNSFPLSAFMQPPRPIRTGLRYPGEPGVLRKRDLDGQDQGNRRSRSVGEASEAPSVPDLQCVRGPLTCIATRYSGIEENRANGSGICWYLATVGLHHAARAPVGNGRRKNSNQRGDQKTNEPLL